MSRPRSRRAAVAAAACLVLIAGGAVRAHDPKPGEAPVKAPQVAPRSAARVDLEQAERKLRARAQRYRGAANGIRVQGRALFPEDHARIAAYERAAKLLAGASDALAKLRKLEKPPSTRASIIEALPADARRSFQAALGLPADPSKLRIGDSPDGNRRSKKAPPASRERIERALEKLERAHRLAELRAERLELEARRARLEAERIEIQAEMLRNRIRQQAAEQGKPDPFADEDEGDEDEDDEAALRLEGVKLSTADGAWLLQTVHVGGYDELSRVFGDLAKYAREKGFEVTGPAVTIHDRAPGKDGGGESAIICAFVIGGPEKLLRPFATKAYELRKAPPVRVLSQRARGSYSRTGEVLERLYRVAEREELEPSGSWRAFYFDDPAEVEPERTRFEVQLPVK